MMDTTRRILPEDPSQLLIHLICNNIHDFDTYKDAVTRVFNGAHSKRKTFHLLLDTVRLSASAMGDTSNRTALLLSLGQTICDDDGFFRLYGRRIFDYNFKEKSAAVFMEWLLQDDNKATRKQITQQCTACEIYKPFKAIAQTTNSKRAVIARRFFIAFNCVPPFASAKLLLECGAAGVFEPVSQAVVSEALATIKEKDTEIAKNDSILFSTRLRNAALLTTQERLQVECAAARAEVDTLKKEMARREETKSRLDDLVQEAWNSIKTLTDTHENIKTDNEKLTADNEKLKADNEMLKVIIKSGIFQCASIIKSATGANIVHEKRIKDLQQGILEASEFLKSND